MQIVLTSEILLAAYAQGIFPMAERADSSHLHWFCPEKRGQLSIRDLHVSRRLKAKILGGASDIRIDTDFQQVIESCARKRPERLESWINQPIIDAFCKLHIEGHAHSVECWRAGEMVGGIYGLSIGGAFFGESMFSVQTDASKICLVHLAARLWAAGYSVFDTQFTNPHLEQFGVYEISYEDYLSHLSQAVTQSCDFKGWQQSEGELVRAYFNGRSSS